jgi:hypothetical protein
MEFFFFFSFFLFLFSSTHCGKRATASPEGKHIKYILQHPFDGCLSVTLSFYSGQEQHTGR